MGNLGNRAHMLPLGEIAKTVAIYNFRSSAGVVATGTEVLYFWRAGETKSQTAA